jgi:hypothetical protein
MDLWLHGSVDPRPTGHRPPGETSWKPGGVHALHAVLLCRAGLLHTLYFTGSHSEAFRPVLFPSPSAYWVQVAGQKGLRIIVTRVRVLSEVLSLQW